ncbi:MAG: acyltransferase [Planctomycetota bacterium]|jgi:acetyltransferase-like isoleucine patch superfamily enzyme
MWEAETKGGAIKRARRIFLPAVHVASNSFAVVETVLGFARDIVKAVYLAGIQLYVRLVCVEREFPSSIRLRARLDVVPLTAGCERHRLSVGRHALIEIHSVICTWHGDVIVKEGASVGIGSVVVGPVQIGENSAVAQHCFISGQSHCYEDVSQNFRTQGFQIAPVVIQKDAWIGSNCVILPGVKIGNNSVIGAGSVVVRDIPPYRVAVGNPAKVIKKFDFDTEKWVRV